jgi:xanthine dehydrogenase accessory factor
MIFSFSSFMLLMEGRDTSMKSIYFQLLARIKGKKPAALATILETEGSAPQVPGASALFSPRGLVAGTLGGGILEGDAQKKAIRALKDKAPLVYSFKLEAAISEEGAACGGRATILIDPCPENDREVLAALNKSIDRGEAGILGAIISLFSRRKPDIRRLWISRSAISKSPTFEPSESELLASGPPTLSFRKHSLAGAGPVLRDSDANEKIYSLYMIYKKEIALTLRDRQPRLVSVQRKHLAGKAKAAMIYFEPVFPLSRLVIAGAGHIGRAVSHLGSLLDFEVTVIDDRLEFANKKNLPDADRIICEDIGKAIGRLSVTPDTYIVIVTRGHLHDADALRACIKSGAAYIGMIGSRNKIEMMRREFLDKGLATPAEWSRIHSPIGLPIHSKTVAEIAVSIAAELVLVRRQIQERGWRREGKAEIPSREILK